MAGEVSALTHEAPFMLTMTSGTTANQKFIPVTRESQTLNSSLMAHWLHRAPRIIPIDGLTPALVLSVRLLEGHTGSEFLMAVPLV